jgi:hypothetical protein
MKTRQTIIFTNSYSPRTGHNFVSEVLKVITDHEVLAHSRSETKLSTMLNAYYEIYNTMVYFKTDKNFMDTLFIENLRERILSESEKTYINIKDTTFVGARALIDVFPNDHHILVFRHPNDVFSSIFKAMGLKRKGVKNFLKRLLLPTGIYPFIYCRKISNRVIKLIPDFNGFYILKYEDLVLKNEEVLLDLKHKFNSPKSLEQIKSEIEDINVINTSFYKENQATSIWDAKEKSPTFNPVNRKEHSFFIRKGIALGAKKLTKHLNYN